MVQPALRLDVDARRPLAATVGAYVRLTKPRVIELLLVTAVPPMFLAEGGIPVWSLIFAVVVGGALAAGGANTINCWIERDRDQLMRRTHGRPLPMGEINPTHALVFGIVLNVIAFALLATVANLLAAALTLSATLFYVFVYTIWLKPRTVQNIVIGGAAGAVPALVGWAAVANDLAAPAWILFLVVFLWTPAHFWALALKYRDDYAAAGIPMLPVVAGVDMTAKADLRLRDGHRRGHVRARADGLGRSAVRDHGGRHRRRVRAPGARVAPRPDAQARHPLLRVLEHLPHGRVRRGRGRRARVLGPAPCRAAGSPPSS